MHCSKFMKSFEGMMSALRMLGPVFGYMIGSFFLKIYIAPSLTPTINNNDPRWLGAWWAGT